MEFNNVIQALEWYVRHRSGSAPRRTEQDRIHGSFDGAQVAAVDIERILERFPIAHQKALVAMAINGRTETLKTFPHFELFLGHVLKAFNRAMTEAGYLVKQTPPGATLQAAAA